MENFNSNTFFFLNHNSSFPILETIRSRCTEFKIFFNSEEKKNILKKLLASLNLGEMINDQFYNKYKHESPGNLLKYIFTTL